MAIDVKRSAFGIAFSIPDSAFGNLKYGIQYETRSKYRGAIAGGYSAQRTDRLQCMGRERPTRMSVPGRKISSTFPSVLDVLSYTAKMVPVDTLQSMLEEPSRGSNATQNFPANRKDKNGGRGARGDDERLNPENQPTAWTDETSPMPVPVPVLVLALVIGP